MNIVLELGLDRASHNLNAQLHHRVLEDGWFIHVAIYCTQIKHF
jgi:hypothetical protein